jgi:hypothetical protein
MEIYDMHKVYTLFQGIRIISFPITFPAVYIVSFSNTLETKADVLTTNFILSDWSAFRLWVWS